MYLVCNTAKYECYVFEYTEYIRIVYSREFYEIRVPTS